MPLRDNRISRTVFSAFSQYMKDGGLYLAASISFFALISLVPLLVLSVTVFAEVVGKSANLQTAVMNYITAVYPLAGPALKRELFRIAGHAEAGWISIIIFLWLSSVVFDSIEYAVNIIFKSDNRRRYLVSKLIALALVLFSGLLFSISFWITYIPQFIASHPNYFTSTNLFKLIEHSLLFRVVPIIFTILSFTIIYKVLPKFHVPLKYAVYSGITAGLLWEAAKYAFSWYVGIVAPFGIYGSLSTIVFFMLWVYYSATILLLVAEMLHSLMSRKNS
ncbi:MAG TPA: YihY/virulence factor BrkB family protein [Nitrospirota bacterium]